MDDSHAMVTHRRNSFQGTLAYVEADEVNKDKMSNAAEIIWKICESNP
jgi:hypothetical protein